MPSSQSISEMLMPWSVTLIYELLCSTN